MKKTLIDAKVHGNARVLGSARVYGTARVHGEVYEDIMKHLNKNRSERKLK